MSGTIILLIISMSIIKLSDEDAIKLNDKIQEMYHEDKIIEGITD